MIAPEVADSGASTLGASDAKGPSKLGALGAVKPAKTSHPYIVGLSLVAVGAFGLVGSITGTLPSMIAALFVPNALVDKAGNTPAPTLLNKAASLSEGIVTGGVVGTNPIKAYNNLNLNRFIPSWLGGTGTSL
jgi:hypothetical protein